MTTKAKPVPVPSRIVVRAKVNGAIVHHAASAIEATRWMERKNCPLADYTISKSYTAWAAYYNRVLKMWFEPEFRSEAGQFGLAVDALQAWVHQQWEVDRNNHPSPAGRAEVWERWNDVVALLNIASLTSVRNPQFNYRFGPLSPPEGRGHDLRLGVVPTPVEELDRLKWV